MSPGFILSGEKLIFILFFGILEILEIISKQIFSVVSGAIVLSIITKFFFLINFATNLQASIKFLRFGLFALLTGVGTVIKNTSALKVFICLFVKNFIFDFFKTKLFIS